MKMFAQLTWTLARLHLLPLDTGYGKRDRGCGMRDRGYCVLAMQLLLLATVGCARILSSLLFSIRSLACGAATVGHTVGFLWYLL